jgi:16S rRNA processing protein RimM
LRQEEPDRFIAIARIVRPQGRRGEVIGEILTDFPARFQDLCRAFLENPGHAPDPVAVERVWLHKGRVVLKFSGVDSIASASRLRGRHVLIPCEERAPLPPHQYYLWELKGCRVVTEQEGTQNEIGMVTDVERTGGVDLLHVVRHRRGRREVLIPLAQAICTRIDIQAKTIVVDPPEDLLELNP